MHLAFMKLYHVYRAWLHLIIRPLFLYCLNGWIIRNEERHGKDDETKKSLLAAGSQVEQDLYVLYHTARCPSS